jgi:hypothetical protein
MVKPRVTLTNKGRSFSWEKRWLVAYTIFWFVVLIPAVAVLGGVKEKFLFLRVVAGPVEALAAAIGAVVLGGWVLDAVQRRIDRERAQDWLRRNFKFALESQAVLLETAAGVAVLTYRRITRT